MVRAARALLPGVVGSGRRQWDEAFEGIVESLFRKRFYIVHLALLALAAFLLARVVTTIAAHFVYNKLAPPTSAAAPKVAATKPPAMRDFGAAAEQNIFEARREVVADSPAGAVSSGTACESDWDSAAKTSLRLRLVGTVVFEEPVASLASIVDEGKSGSVAELFSINECQEQDLSGLSPEDRKLVAEPPPCQRVGDSAVLKRIEPERVFISNEGTCEYIAINEPPTKGGPVVAKSEPSTPAGDGKDLGAGIIKTGENSFKVPRSNVDDALNSLGDLATQARIVPAFEGGKPVGFKLFSIRPGSLYSKIGLQNGDVINRINGYEMSSPEKGLEIYQKLKDSASVTVDVKRRGKPMTLDYAIE